METGRAGMAAGSSKATRVLVVDDAQVMRRAVEKMLQPEYEVILANDGEAGWEILTRDEQIEMLITDIQMPRLDGYGLICRVRADTKARIRDVPIITITGAEDDETRIRAYACGSTDFLIKPFDKKLLHSRVHAYLRLKQASLLHTAGNQKSASTVDPLTRLSGLGAFLEAGKAMFARGREQSQDLSVAALDIDEFAALRRQHGDTVVGQMLVRVADILNSTVRREDMVARVGQAEFAVLIPQTGRVQALALCERVRERIANEALAADTGAVAASFGLVTLSTDAPETFEKFLVLVEQRLSQARSDGGNRVGVTLLRDVMPEPEVVVLAGVAENMDVQPNDADEIELSVEAGELSVTELEALVRAETIRHKPRPRST